jgi:hypothetical protein
MKKPILLVLLAIGFLSFNKLENAYLNEKLTETELKFVTENYNWNSKEFIIVNFRMPKSNCHYNNYANLKKSTEWWTKYYSKINLDNVHNIFVYSDNKKAKKIIDSKKHFADSNSFFLNKFFNQDKTCYGILVIKKNGEFQKKSGEYTEENVIELINNLKSIRVTTTCIINCLF